jgi:pyrroline-5-carboxylate reductase
MNHPIHLAFIGAGNMSSAMIGGLCKSEDSPFILGLASRTKEKCEPFRSMGVTVFDDNVSAMLWASFASVLPVHGAMMSISKSFCGPIGSAWAMVWMGVRPQISVAF